jgi:hypothetical protein
MATANEESNSVHDESPTETVDKAYFMENPQIAPFEFSIRGGNEEFRQTMIMIGPPWSPTAAAVVYAMFSERILSGLCQCMVPCQFLLRQFDRPVCARERCHPPSSRCAASRSTIF